MLWRRRSIPAAAYLPPIKPMRPFSLIDLPKIVDPRGNLTVAEQLKNVPFDIARVYWTYDIPAGERRGGHAHRTCEMVLFPIGGSFDIELDDGEHRTVLHMDDPSQGVFIPPLVWCKLLNFTKDAACISLASEEYRAEDYIHDYEEFLKLIKD